jgi:hypothetical protein
MRAVQTGCCGSAASVPSSSGNGVYVFGPATFLGAAVVIAGLLQASGAFADLLAEQAALEGFTAFANAGVDATNKIRARIGLIGPPFEIGGKRLGKMVRRWLP